MKEKHNILKIVLFVSAAAVAAILAGIGIYDKLKKEDSAEAIENDEFFEDEDIFEDEDFFADEFKDEEI